MTAILASLSDEVLRCRTKVDLYIRKISANFIKPPLSISEAG
jgi:hypothetical protein